MSAVTEVLFKEENVINGISVGPVLLVGDDKTEYIELHGWYTQTFAHKLASQLDVPLKEA